MEQQFSFFESTEDRQKQGGGNRRMIAHGIQDEQSDFRIHVSYVTQHAYIFPTSSGVKAIEIAARNGAARKQAYQPGVKAPTALGYPIPISHIDGLIEVLIPRDIFNTHFAQKHMSTSYKGLKATELVVEMLKTNLIPLPLQVDVTDDKALQISGTDIIVHSKLHIQVKCDYRCGAKKHSKQATGNLYLQVAECNPFKRY